MNLRFALLALLLLGISFAGLSISEYAISPEVIEPGTSGVLQITVSNSALSDSVENVVITATSTEQLGISRSFAVGDLEEGASVTVAIPFSAAKEAKSGYYTVEVTALGTTNSYYLDKNGQLQAKLGAFEKRSSFPVQIVELPVLSVGLSEDSLEDITQETFIFTNSGGVAKKVRITVSEVDPSQYQSQAQSASAS
jgi:hypothetical protein